MDFWCRHYLTRLALARLGATALPGNAPDPKARMPAGQFRKKAGMFFDIENKTGAVEIKVKDQAAGPQVP